MKINPFAVEIRTRKLGVLLRNAREVAQKSPNEAAKLLGIHEDELEAFESGETSPSLPQLEALANYYGVLLSHFWDNHLLEENNHAEVINLETIREIRQRIIGAGIRKQRLEKGVDVETLAHAIKVNPTEIEAYEFAELSIPLPILEAITQFLDEPLDHFVDHETKLGKKLQQQQRWAGFQGLPDELQDFISKPTNRPYLQLAQRLSEMSVEKLRAVAEGLLEITL